MEFFLSEAAGAGLDLLCGSFLEAILDVKKKNSMFEPTLQRLEDTLKSMEKSVNRIDYFNRDINREGDLNGLKDLMTKGKGLVLECLQIHRYNIIKRPSHARKLLKLEENIRRYANTVLQLQQSADGKETLFKVKQMSDQFMKLNRAASINSSSNSNVGAEIFGGIGLMDMCSPPELKVDPVGLEIPLKELKRRLLQDEVSMVVLSAAGGCGKTTLATAFCHDLEVKRKFRENIFFFTVSKSPNLLVIVERMFQHLGCMVPDFGGEEDALNQLEHLLKLLGPNPILLVLDDVWHGSETLLEKLGFRIANYQILVTSRSEFHRFDSTYKLPTLNEADAMRLFSRSAFPPDGNSYQPDEDLVNKIVAACKGFPLALSIIGKSLYRMPAAEWRKRARECAQASSILVDELLTRLQSSVDAMNDKAAMKECYMDLGSFPEDQRIPAAALIDMWAELHGLNEDEAMCNLYELSHRGLIDLLITRKDANEDDSSYNDHFISQHDLLRQLAILQSTTGAINSRKRIFMDASVNQYPQWWNKEMQSFDNAKLLSINTDEGFASSMQAPEVQVLVLNLHSKNYTLPEFMKTMEKLSVLVVGNWGFLPAEFSNFYLLSSLSNLKRLRLERATLPSFAFTSMQFRKLEKISLVMCNIGQAFSESTIQLSAAFPNLMEVNIDYCNDLIVLPNGFCDLLQLKKLRITNCHKLSALPGQLGMLVNLEVLRLNSCSDLAELPNTIGSLHNLRILDLSDCLRVKRLPEQIGGLYNLSKLYMADCSRCRLPSSVRNLVNLKEVIGDEQTANSWETFRPDLPHLRIKVHKDNDLGWLA